MATSKLIITYSVHRFVATAAPHPAHTKVLVATNSAMSCLLFQSVAMIAAVYCLLLLLGFSVFVGLQVLALYMMDFLLMLIEFDITLLMMLMFGHLVDLDLP